MTVRTGQDQLNPIWKDRTIGVGYQGVQTFAPELKTAVSVSLPRLQEHWSKLARG